MKTDTGEKSDTTSDLPWPVILLRQPNLGTNVVVMYVCGEWVCMQLYICRYK